MMSDTKWITLAVLALGAAACGGKDGESNAADSVPSQQTLALEITGGTDDVAPAPQSVPAQAAETVAATTGLPAVNDDLAEAQSKIRSVNSAIANIVTHVRGVALNNGVPAPGRGKLYGPADRCTVDDVNPCPDGASATFLLWVGRSLIPGHGGEFVLLAKAVGAPDSAYKTVLAGWMRRSGDPGRGVGQIWINLENVRAAAPQYPGQGYLYGGFAANDRGAKRLTYVLAGFTPDPEKWDAASVALRGFRTAAGTARVRVAALHDYLSGPNGDELGLFHVVYNPDIGGRAYGIVSNYLTGATLHGDVPSGKYFLGRACYAAHAPTAPLYKEWFLCDLGTGPAACLSSGTPTPVVGTGSWDTNCLPAAAPAESAPPEDGDLAAGALSQDPLPGEADTGIDAEPPPSDTDEPPAAP